MDVIISSTPEKLPGEVQAMIDEKQPLAADIRFFEEKFTDGGMIRTMGLGLVLGVVGVLLFLFGLYLILHPGPNFRGFDSYDLLPALAGLVALFGSYLLIASLKARRAVTQAQQAGAGTRYGIFLAGDLLVSRSWFDTTVIPRALFQGLQDRAVQYLVNEQTKSFNLPTAIVGGDTAEMDAAIRAWAGGA